MDAQHFDESSDERLVRMALRAAYPPTRSTFSQRRGQQIVRAAAVERLNDPPATGSRVAACVAASVVLLAGTAGAASAALPGQPLYPLKRIVERAMVAATADDADAARLELRFAQRRLREASAVGSEDAGALTDRYQEHINAANALAGDDISREIEELRDSEVERQSVPAADGAAAGDRVGGRRRLAAAVPTTSASSTPTPTPTPTPAPSESVSPSPSPTPQPSAAPEAPAALEPVIEALGEVSPLRDRNPLGPRAKR